MKNKINKTDKTWQTLGVVLRVADASAFLRELENRDDLFIVYSKTTRLKILLVEEAF